MNKLHIILFYFFILLSIHSFTYGVESFFSPTSNYQIKEIYPNKDHEIIFINIVYYTMQKSKQIMNYWNIWKNIQEKLSYHHDIIINRMRNPSKKLYEEWNYNFNIDISKFYEETNIIFDAYALLINQYSNTIPEQKALETIKISLYNQFYSKLSSIESILILINNIYSPKRNIIDSTKNFLQKGIEIATEFFLPEQYAYNIFVKADESLCSISKLTQETSYKITQYHQSFWNEIEKIKYDIYNTVYNNLIEEYFKKYQKNPYLIVSIDKKLYMTTIPLL